jgi:hypothetical protein
LIDAFQYRPQEHLNIGRKVFTLQTTPFTGCHGILIYNMLRKGLDNMKAERLALIMIVAAAIFVTPSVLTNPVLAQTGTETEGTTNGGTTGGGTTGTADEETPSEMYQTFQSCLETAEGTETWAEEQEIRDCFIDAGFTGAGDDNDTEDEDENEDDENENEDDDEETN